MKLRVIVLALALLAGVAADKPQRADQDLIAISNAAREYRPEGSTLAQISLNAGRDMAHVRYLVRRDGQDVAVSVLTVKRTSKGWEVESCAR